MKTANDKPAGEKAKVAVLGLFLLIALGGVYYSWSRSQAPSAPAVMDVQQLAHSPVGPEVDQLIQSVEARLREDAKFINLADWHTPAAVASAPTRAEIAPVSFKLKGVAMNGDQSIAFINEKVVGLGEQVDGYTLAEINPDRVVLTDARGRRIEVGHTDP